MVNHNLPSRKPHDWVPPVPAFSARISEPVTIAYFGIQQRGSGADVEAFRAWTRQLTTGESAPEWRDCAEYTDENGHHTWVSIFYWRARSDAYRAWTERSDYGAFWNDSARLEGDTGYFREVLHVPNERLETLYSHTEMDTGVGGNSGEHEGPIQAHNYWGSMRDRVPLSGTDPLEPPQLITSERDVNRHQSVGARVALAGVENLATIRSGHIYDDLEGRELEVFDGEIMPSLHEGMMYLRDNPVESGCYVCRDMSETDGDGVARKRGFATAHFDSLTRLEDWAESHPTHLRIFGRFIELATELKGDIKLKLWHEVTVVPASMQEYEYLNCAPGTGMMPFASAREVTAPVSH
jgi:aldoxime dehydratase